MSETQKTPKAILTEDQQSVIDQLVDLQEKLGKSDREFARDHLNFSATKWNKIKNGRYFEEVASADQIILQLQLDLRRLQRNFARANRMETRQFHAFTDFAAIFNAIDVCLHKRNPDRLIVYTADTGGGKSALCQQIEKQFNGAVVEARQSWETSYYSALRDVCEAFSVSTEGTYSPDVLEERLIIKLNQNRRVLAIDEGEYFGRRVLNLWKLLLNKTPTVIVIAAIKESFDRWNSKNWHEAKQLRRRTHCIVSHQKIAPDEAAEFLTGLPLNGSLKDAATKLAKAANEFGQFDFITRVVDELKREKQIDLDEVEAAITRVRAFMGVETES